MGMIGRREGDGRRDWRRSEAGGEDLGTQREGKIVVKKVELLLQLQISLLLASY